MKVKGFLAVYRRLFLLLKSAPGIIAPFLALGVVYESLLAASFCAPMFPLSPVLAPVIRAFWGEQFLHYPMNFLLLPRLFELGKTALDFLPGLVLSATAVALVAQADERQPVKMGDGMKKVLSRYLRLVVIWGITLGIALGLVRLVRYAGYLWPLREFVVWGEVAVSVLVQMLLVFALPSVVIENKKVTVSLARSLQLLRRYPLTVLLLVGIPNLLLAPFLYLQSRIPTLMQRYFPETALCVMAAYVAVIVLADFLITASSALLLLMHREAEKGVMHP
jgi:hypothetical protein